MSDLNQQNGVPSHIAFIMDGNGRWAKQRGLPREHGHRFGVKAFEEVLRLEAEIARLTAEIATRDDYESEGYETLLHRLNEAQDQFQLLGGETRDADIEKTLLGLGFKRSDFGRATSEFSGGWRMRIELAKLLLRRPSIFLLDERYAVYLDHALGVVLCQLLESSAHSCRQNNCLHIILRFLSHFHLFSVLRLPSRTP